MITVVANDSDRAVVLEFFQLFKTPWRFYEEGCTDDVLLCATDEVPPSAAKLVILCGSKNQSTAGRRARSQTMVSMGLDLFAETRDLLTFGQPPEKAGTPTLDLHIATLRRLIVEHGIELVEIPPVPSGYQFVACLTHDVDHARVRYHKWDPAILGFLYRATAGSIVDLFAGRKRLGQVATNCTAAVSLPFVYAGAARDCWDQFERFLEVEDGAPSTFFFVPRRDYPGVDANGREPRKRAVRYSLDDVAADIERLRSAGREIGVHGVDAWRDSTKGGEELRAIQKHASGEQPGVRMHWLFFNEHSPRLLEDAGFSYDSTVGYNNTVGYRAGTAQVFKPLGVDRLLELPLHIMDTALFFPSHMHLSERQAAAAVAPLLEHAERAGGVVTVNWHDRSLGPERLWQEPYVHLIDSMRTKRAWFATARDVVAWFRKRRAAEFETVSDESGAVRVKVSQPGGDALPALQLRTYRSGSAAAFRDEPLQSSDQLLVAA